MTDVRATPCADWIAAYHELGWNCVPLIIGTRKPEVKWAAYQTERITDEQVAEWAEFRAGCGLAVVCGEVSGNIVADIDSPEGQAAIDRLGMPHTPTVRTGSGKRHYHLKVPSWHVRNISVLPDLPGIEIKGVGGLATLPPSLHYKTGKPFAWEVDPFTTPLADPPGWLLELIKEPPPPPPRAPYAPLPTNGQDPYKDTAVENVLGDLAGVTTNRNDELNIAAFRLGQFVGANRLDWAEAEHQLSTRALAIGLEKRETDATIKSGLDFGMTQPEYKGLEPEPVERKRPAMVQPPDPDPEPETELAQGAARATPDPETEPGTESEPPPPAQDETTPDIAAFAERAGWTKALADEITTDYHFAREPHGGSLWYYDGTKYVRTGERVVDRNVKRVMEAQQATKSWSAYRVREVCKYILADAPDIWAIPPIETIAVANGLLNWRTGELSPHTHEHLSPVYLPVTYDPEAVCPNWHEFIDAVFPEDSKHLAFDLAGWLMIPYTGLQKAVMLIGEGGTGKSTFLTALTAFLGTENVSGVTLQSLENDQYASSRLVGKLANIFADLPSTHLAGTSIFKALTGGDRVPAERKYETSFEFDNYARLLFSANKPPASNDTSSAFFDRWLVVPFDNKFRDTEGEVRNYADRLTTETELSGLLNYALVSLHKVLADGIEETPTMKKAWLSLKEITSPIEVWLNANLYDDAKVHVTRKALLRAYNRHAEKTGKGAETPECFTKAVKEWRPELRETRPTVNGKRERAWKGVGLVSETYAD